MGVVVGVFLVVAILIKRDLDFDKNDLENERGPKKVKSSIEKSKDGSLDRKRAIEKKSKISSIEIFESHLDREKFPDFDLKSVTNILKRPRPRLLKIITPIIKNSP